MSKICINNKKANLNYYHKIRLKQGLLLSPNVKIVIQNFKLIKKATPCAN